MSDQNNKSREKLYEYQSIVNDSIDALNEESAFFGTPLKAKEKRIFITKSFRSSKLFVVLTALVLVNIFIFLLLNSKNDTRDLELRPLSSSDITGPKHIIEPVINFTKYHKLYTNSQDPTFYHDFDNLLESLSIPPTARQNILKKEIKNLRFGITWAGVLHPTDSEPVTE